MTNTMAVAQIEELLGPEQQVIAKLSCVGFDDMAVGMKNDDLHNKSSHVILPNLYEATPRPGQRAPSVPHANVHRTDCTGVTTDFGCDRMAANAGTRLQEKNKTSSPAPSDHSQALTPRCPLSVSLLCI